MVVKTRKGVIFLRHYAFPHKNNSDIRFVIQSTPDFIRIMKQSNGCKKAERRYFHKELCFPAKTTPINDFLITLTPYLRHALINILEE